MKTRVVAIAAAVVAAVAAYVLFAGRAAPPKPRITLTGIYADDWQANCAPLTGPAQADCTARLDAGYGKADGAPVPPMK